jgi:hypothetical protein
MTTKNQTRAEWIARAEIEVGTGFIIYQTSDGRLRSRYHRDIAYAKCVVLGAASLTFKWIPNSVASFESIKNTKCIPVECEGKECAQPGCACLNRRCGNAEDQDRGELKVHPGLTGGRKSERELVR